MGSVKGNTDTEKYFGTFKKVMILTTKKSVRDESGERWKKERQFMVDRRDNEDNKKGTL